ncbi:MAG: NAD(P)H-dependent glycerol-3-phosphate dehydrogenase [Nanoarchaeota archaeon]
MNKISFYGFGAFNSALAHYFDKEKNFSMSCYDKDEKVKESIDKERRHPHHFTNMTYSKKLSVTNDLKELLLAAEFLIIGLPTQIIRENLKPIKDLLNKETTIIIVSKGLEIGTNKRISEIVKEELGHRKIAVFAGGTVASDIANRIPLIAEVASEDKETREKVAGLFHSESLRIYTNPDVVSVELSSALKNIVSIGAGICDGLGFTIGTKASFITRATRDIYKIAKAMGAHDKTFLPGSASVWGDIILSAFGPTRNYEFGKRLCSKNPKEVLELMNKEHKTIEGYWTVKAVRTMSKEKGIDTPCIEQVYKIVHEEVKPLVALKELFERKRTSIDSND